MQTADGIIVSPSRPPRSGRHRLAASPVPIVTCDEPADSLLIAGSVRSDNFGGGRAAAHHLVDAGGTRFGLVGGHGYLPSTQERRDGFLAGLADRGVPHPLWRSRGRSMAWTGDKRVWPSSWRRHRTSTPSSPSPPSARTGRASRRALELLDEAMNGAGPAGYGAARVLAVSLVEGESTRRP
ncbi:substrate-binding domain-containing protein [Microbacterium laevaniformans]|uniref:substrate-binding domain-containing protein n=1 Tax=Microbacterium laevaniformans TaxID=36807 RepID=UPI000A45E1EE|nr:substrate-binding domain-containing protein [Microbacterium laevaniformans]